MATLTPQQAFALALQHHVAGRFGDAESLCRQILSVQPDHGEALHLLGVIAHLAGRNDIAVDLIRRAITSIPNFPGAYYHLGNALRCNGELDGAVAAYSQAVALRPDYVEAHCNLGNGLKDKGRLDEAVAAYRKAIALNPNIAEVQNNLGDALRQKGLLEEAIVACRQAIKLNFNLHVAHNNLGNALRDKGELHEAIAAYRVAIVLQPNYPEARNNLGATLYDGGQLDEAIAAFRQAIALRPAYSESLNNLGVALNETGQLDDAVAAFLQAISSNPGYSAAHSNLVHTLTFHPGYDAQSIYRQARCWNQQHAEPIRQFIQPHLNERHTSRRLRIGYVSSDFRDHVVGRNILPVVESHDRTNFEIFLYSNSHRSDAISQRFIKAADVQRDIYALSDAAAAELIRADQIDLLVDLSLHLAGNRLSLFARKPAPVQITWAGYPGTTGLDTIDYRITDPYLDPPESSNEYYSEKSIRLPHSFWCYDPLTDVPSVNSLPALSAGHITFGSLNNYSKVNEGVLSLFAKVLRSVKDSRLRLLSKEGQHRQRALEVFMRHEVAPERIEWFTPAPRERYLEAYHHIDVGLDTFPYNGHTTSLDSFWMGVPIITLVGKSVVGRGGLSQAKNLGLSELVVQTPEEYLQLAADMAANLPRLAELRQSMRQRMRSSPLMDARRFTLDLEACYRSMWRQWCDGQVP